MPSRLEVDLPYPGDTMPFGELEMFVKQAISAGATPDTLVTAVPVDNHDEMVDSLRIEFDQVGPVRVERQDLAELLGLLAEIEQNDGDARAQLRAIQGLRQRLTGQG
ncbi:hypothetical protein ACFVAV_33495 [Nocardia sp. NPDC057663]|uniref:hypothetical protein n=1 Tax=Nocardia sp. NPDC057663 TaxID=3346201 RepID=UPI00366D02A5